MSREIPLSRGMVSLVDEADFEALNAYRWLANGPHSNGKFYAHRFERIGGSRSNIYMHRQIMQPGVGRVVDHINGDPLDNRRANLRVSSQAFNAVNRDGVLSATGFRGVFIDWQRRCFLASLSIEGQQQHIGRYENAREAAEAYDAAARERHGEFARLNFPKTGERGTPPEPSLINRDAG